MEPDRVAPLALGLAVILVLAKIGGHVSARLGQVAVLGELLAGVALGNVPFARERMAWLHEDPSIDMVARLGALVLLFDVGLELTVREVVAVGRSAAAVATLGTAASLALGYGVATWLRPDASAYHHVFLGAALTATSIGITARVLKDLGQTKSREARVILGAAVIDDVMGLVVLAFVTGAIAAASHEGHLSGASVAWIVLEAVAFFAATIVVGVKIATPLFSAAAKLRTSGAQVAIGLAFCFVTAWAASAIGLAAIVGAFTAGLILEESHSARFVARGERSLSELVEPVSSFLVPVFFVVMGARVDVRVLASPRTLAIAGALLVAALLGKLACALGAGGARKAAVAFGMIPRGEVTLIYASLGGSLAFGGQPLLDPALYSALVVVVVATTLVTPMALKWALR